MGVGGGMLLGEVDRARELMELAAAAERERKSQSTARCEIRLDGDSYVGILDGEGKRE